MVELICYEYPTLMTISPHVQFHDGQAEVPDAVAEQVLKKFAHLGITKADGEKQESNTVVDELLTMNKPELQALAASLEVEFTSKTTKAALADLIRYKQAESASDGETDSKENVAPEDETDLEDVDLDSADIDQLREIAKGLEIEFEDDTSAEDLVGLIRDFESEDEKTGTDAAAEVGLDL